MEVPEGNPHVCGGGGGGQQKPVPTLAGVKHVVAVGAGKGGVGKSTVAVLLAVGLRRRGARVGLLDADVYGPSIPKLLGVPDARPAVNKDQFIPVEAAGLKVMSIGFIIDQDQPVVWRGPMVHGAVTQFVGQVAWGELDYLIVDLPPGTGDVPLSLSQALPLAGSVIVCTPQDLALADARRALRMYEALRVPTLGIVENMSYYLCPKCGHRDEIFDHGGAAAAARETGVPFLGEVPLNSQVRACADAGDPEQLYGDASSPVGAALDVLVDNVAAQIEARAAETCPTTGCTSCQHGD